MKLCARAFAGVGVVLLVVSVWAIRNTELPSEDFTISAGRCRVPVTVVEPVRNETGGGTRRAAIVLHGLAANRRVMRLLGESLAADDDLHVYLLDLPGHGDNTEPFSFARVEECAAAVAEKLIRDGTISPTQTAIVGHSMGGAIAIRLADRVPLAATVALSPAPMILSRRMPANLAVFSAQYDLPALKHQAETLSQAAGGDRDAADDFAELRAFRLERVARANHHSVLDDPLVAAQAATWIAASLDPAALRANELSTWTGRVHSLSSRFAGFYVAKRSYRVALIAAVAPLVGAIGIILLFPLALDIASRRAGRNGEANNPGVKPRRSAERPSSAKFRDVFDVPTEPIAPRISPALALIEGSVCAFAAVLALRVALPLRFLHMYSGDYLASLLIIFGALLIAFNLRAAKDAWSWKPGAFLAAVMLGFAVMLAIGAWLNWRLVDLWLNGARWWRFAALLPFCFAFSFSEEVVLGPVRRGKRRAWRLVIFLLLRFELWLAAVFAFYALGSGQVVIGVLAPALAGFSIVQRLGTDKIRASTGSAVAAAVFGAILAAWFIAAVFPLN